VQPVPGLVGVMSHSGWEWKTWLWCAACAWVGWSDVTLWLRMKNVTVMCSLCLGWLEWCHTLVENEKRDCDVQPVPGLVGVMSHSGWEWKTWLWCTACAWVGWSDVTLWLRMKNVTVMYSLCLGWLEWCHTLVENEKRDCDVQPVPGLVGVMSHSGWEWKAWLWCTACAWAVAFRINKQLAGVKTFLRN